MTDPARIQRVTADQRVPGPPTPGMDRQQAFQTEGTWAGYARTEPNMRSGWHHHGEYESTIYVLAGALRMEWGTGDDVVDAGPGDFVFVPKHVVHREGNPSAEVGEFVVVRAGHGEPNFNVDGPA